MTGKSGGCIAENDPTIFLPLSRIPLLISSLNFVSGKISNVELKAILAERYFSILKYKLDFSKLLSSSLVLSSLIKASSQPGQKYIFHHDAATDKKLIEYERKISVILYLNEGFEGGGTEFIHTALKPKPGYAIIFPSNWCYPHAGQEVISGKKRIAVTWYYVDWA